MAPLESPSSSSRRSGTGRSRRPPQASQPSPSSSSRTRRDSRGGRYVPGGPGGGGRYVYDDGSAAPVGGTGPGGPLYTGPRGRVGRDNAERGVETPITFPRRDRSTRTRTVLPRSQQPAMRFSSAAQVAAAVVQSDGYKPREERGWEEFHPHLDIEANLTIYSADEVDGVQKSRPVTPADLSATSSVNGFHTPNGDKSASVGQLTPVGSVDGDGLTFSIPGTPGTKRRPGRPPKDPIAFYSQKAKAAGKTLILPLLLSVNNATPNTPRIAPLQNQHAKERLTLPQPSYRKTDTLSRYEDKASGLVRYVDKSMAKVGYQESDEFIRPDRLYIKMVDSNLDEDLDMGPSAQKDGATNAPLGSGGVGRVEYDMDEQDDKWLDFLNKQRKAMTVEPITRELFEITITKIEKEWHALEKRIPKPNPKPPQTHRPRSSSAAAVNGEPQVGEEQDSKCAICDDGDCENTNAIVFCDGCDLAVHQECYGVPFIPEGQWLCRKCQLIGRGIPTCIFCPNTDGAFKQTNSSKWAHLLCAMWIPEVSLGNHTFMEPVMDVEKVPKTRWKLNCYICNQKMGACIQCGNKNCYQAFHVTCARRARLFLKMKNGSGQLAILDGSTVLKAFCDKHCPLDYSKENDVARATRDARLFYKKTMKGRLWADSQASALALAASHPKFVTENPADESQMLGHSMEMTDPKKGNQSGKLVWKLPSGAPVIPAVVYDSVSSSLARFGIRKRKEYAAEACRYWTLKREARRGAALLKRLQLQMETFSSMEITRRNFAGMGPAGRGRLDRRIQFAERLITDLSHLKELSSSTRDREFEKLKQAQLEEEAVDIMYFPIARMLPWIVERALALDNKKVFTKGLLELLETLRQRAILLATTFVENFTAILAKGIAEGIPFIVPGSNPEKHHELLSPSKHGGNNIKDRRALAKRIVKAVSEKLEAAILFEAETYGHSAAQMVRDMTKDLENCLELQPEHLNLIGEDQNNHGRSGDNDVDMGGVDQEAAMVGHVADAMDIDEDEDILAHANNHSPQRTVKSKTGYNSKQSDTPPDSTASHHASEHPSPPTPPLSNGGSLPSNGPDGAVESIPSINGGGIPSYIKDNFDPIGTTVLEKKWNGREAAISEELSEIDDDELNDMSLDVEGFENIAVDQGVKQESADVVAVQPPAKKPKAKKRRRDW